MEKNSKTPPSNPKVTTRTAMILNRRLFLNSFRLGRLITYPLMLNLEFLISDCGIRNPISVSDKKINSDYFLVTYE